MNTTKKVPAAYSLVVHAAHYCDATKKNGGGHDLDQWDVTSDVRPADSAVGLAGAEWQYGYRDAEGRQHWVFTRIASFSDVRCGSCPTSKDASGRLL